MTGALDLCNHRHNAMALRNCSISTVCDLFQVLLCPGLIHAPKILFTPFLHSSLGAVFWPTLYRWEFYPSSTHSFYKCAHHVPLTYKSYRETVANFAYTFVTSGNCPCLLVAYELIIWSFSFGVSLLWAMKCLAWWSKFYSENNVQERWFCTYWSSHSLSQFPSWELLLPHSLDFRWALGGIQVCISYSIDDSTPHYSLE